MVTLILHDSMHYNIRRASSNIAKITFLFYITCSKHNFFASEKGFLNKFYKDILCPQNL